MAYSGYLLKVGTYTFPMRGIILKSYKVSYKYQDLDPYRDANGKLHRNVVSNVPAKVEFEVRSGLTNAEYDVIMNSVRGQFTNQAERKANVTLYIPELGSYITQDMYLAEPEITIIRQENSGTLVYDTIRFAWIGY